MSEVTYLGKLMAKAKPALEESVRVGAKHQVTVPSRISRAVRLKKGDPLIIRLVGGGVEIVPATLIPKDQLWFWSREWQEKEREADEDIAAGRIKTAASVDELLKDLNS